MKNKSETLTKNSVFHSEQLGLLTRLVLFSAVILLVGQIVVSWFALSGFQRELGPQLSQKANAVGLSVANQFIYAIADLLIPPNELKGVDAYFEKILAANEDIAYIALHDTAGNVLFSRGIPAETIKQIIKSTAMQDAMQDIEFGSSDLEVDRYADSAFLVEAGIFRDIVLRVGVSTDHIRNELSEIIYEIITVIVISWLVTFEFLYFFMASRVSEPLDYIRKAMAEGVRGIFTNRIAVRTRDEIGQLTTSFNRVLHDMHDRYRDFHFEVQELENAQIDDRIAKKISNVHEKVRSNYKFDRSDGMRLSSANQIRVPLFLFIFSEELLRSFLPLYVSRYAPADLAITQDVLIGLPITLFMISAMIVTPIGGGLVDRIGVPRVFLTGITVAIVGFVGNFFAQSYYDLVAFRVLTGIGYGLVFIASEGWVTQNATARSRASSTGVFVGAVFMGIVCGPPIGGIFADRIGFEATFLISAALALTSGFILYQVFRNSDITEISNQNKIPLIPNLKSWATLAKDLRFCSVLFFAAIPGKMMVSGFIAYLVPLYLSELEHTQSGIGRIMMLYGIATLLCVALAARLADRTRSYARMVAIGTGVAGLGCLLNLFTDAANPSYTVIIAIGALGVSHALTLTSQNSIIQQVAVNYRDTIGQASVISAYRLFERIGMAVGPLVAVLLVLQFGYSGAITAFGAILLVLALVFSIVMAISQNRLPEPHVKAIDA